MNNNNGIIASSKSKTKIEFEVKNENAYPVRIEWINFEGKTQGVGFNVDANSSKKPGTTFVSHVFIAAHAETNQLVGLINVMESVTVIPAVELPSTEVPPIEERPAIVIDGEDYTLKGRVLTADGKSGAGLTVSITDWDRVGGHDFLGTVVTQPDGGFEFAFNRGQFKELYYDKKPDLIFRITDADGKEVYTNEAAPLMNVTEETAPITLTLPAAEAAPAAE